jgi:hypothetical protein
MIIANLMGGLGNQMFQYACARSLACELGKELKFRTDFSGVFKSHNGFELERVFGLKLDFASDTDLGKVIGVTRITPFVRRLLSRQSLQWLAGRSYLSEPSLAFWPNLRERAQRGGYLHGYWQSELYFDRYASRVRTDFQFRERLHGDNLHIANEIGRCTAISIHIRRGDYVSNSKTLAVHGTCSPEYYHAAIATLLQRCPDARLFAFSDDPCWVAQVLQPRYPDMVMVGHNKGLSSYLDMQLMSMCDHHIIANSSFSWWGAWLNGSQDKMVISPSRWFADGRDTHDLIPEGWESL